jgi:hypothetical protein
MYRRAGTYNVPCELLVPVKKKEKGTVVKDWPDTGAVFFCTFKSFGGTEVMKNNVLVVEDTATIETWYDPQITTECRVRTLEVNKTYEIISPIENINGHNLTCLFKVRAVGGGA